MFTALAYLTRYIGIIVITTVALMLLFDHDLFHKLVMAVEGDTAK